LIVLVSYLLVELKSPIKYTCASPHKHLHRWRKSEETIWRELIHWEIEDRDGDTYFNQSTEMQPELRVK